MSTNEVMYFFYGSTMLKFQSTLKHLESLFLGVSLNQWSFNLILRFVDQVRISTYNPSHNLLHTNMIVKPDTQWPALYTLPVFHRWTHYK